MATDGQEVGDISVDSVCQFISAHGGKIKNKELVSHFKQALNNPATRGIHICVIKWIFNLTLPNLYKL